MQPGESHHQEMAMERGFLPHKPRYGKPQLKALFLLVTLTKCRRQDSFCPTLKASTQLCHIQHQPSVQF